MSNSSNISESNDTDIFLSETSEVTSVYEPLIPVAGIFVIVSSIYFILVCIAVTGAVTFHKEPLLICLFSVLKRDYFISILPILRGCCSDTCVSLTQNCSCACRCNKTFLQQLSLIRWHVLTSLRKCSRNIKHVCCEYKVCATCCTCPDDTCQCCVPGWCGGDQETSCEEYECVSCQCSGADQGCGAAQCCCLFIRSS